MRKEIEYWLKQSDYFWDNHYILENMLCKLELVHQNKFMVCLRSKNESKYTIWNLKKRFEALDDEACQYLKDKRNKKKSKHKCLSCGKCGHTHLSYNPSKDKILRAKGMAINMCDYLASGIAPVLEKKWLVDRYVRIVEENDIRFLNKLLENYEARKHKDKTHKNTRYFNTKKKKNMRRPI